MKVYLVWYRDTTAHDTHLWGVYETAEKAEAQKEEARELSYMAWVNEEEVL